LSYARGDFLLKHFLEVLKRAIKPASLNCRKPPSFRANGCEVNDPEAERIDLCIERTCDDEKFAIIIENKIHFAIDQPHQLQGYVQKVHQRGFDYSQIWVFYAPLTAEKDPDPDDRSAVERLGVCYNKITFQTEIVAWLNNALAPGQLDLPSDMDGGMTDNLRHYRDLIRHLIEKHKEFQMKSQILQQLLQAQDAGTMPKFSDMDSTRESIASLQKCLEQVYRAKLMREIHRLLTVQRKKVSFCLEAEPAEEISINSDFDERFDANVDVCVSVDQGVRVCFGGSGETWIGYMKQGRPEDQKRVEARVLSEAKEQLKDVRTNDPKWFGWDYKAIGYTDNCLLTRLDGFDAPENFFYCASGWYGAGTLIA
jgi:hypothetical protein